MSPLIWKRSIGALALCLTQLVASHVGSLTSAHLQAQEFPKGEVLKFSFDTSTIYPGSVRDYWIYVPKQFDGKTPACVHVNQDGINRMHRRFLIG